MGWKFHFATTYGSDFIAPVDTLAPATMYQIEYIIRRIPVIYSVGIHCSTCGFHNRKFQRLYLLISLLHRLLHYPSDAGYREDNYCLCNFHERNFVLYLLRGSCSCCSDRDFFQFQPAVSRAVAVISQFCIYPALDPVETVKLLPTFERQCHNIGANVISGFTHRQQISYRNCLQSVVGLVIIYIVSCFPNPPDGYWLSVQRVSFCDLHRIAVVVVYLDARTVTVGYTFERDAIRYLFLFIRQVHGIQSFQNQKSCIYGFTWVAIESFGGSSCIGVQSVEKAVRVCNQLAVCGRNIACRTNGEQCYTLSSVSY